MTSSTILPGSHAPTPRFQFAKLYPPSITTLFLLMFCNRKSPTILLASTLFRTFQFHLLNQPAQSANAPPMTAPLAAFSTILKPFQFIQSIASFSQQDPVRSSTKFPTPPLSTGTLPPRQWEANILLASLQSVLTIFATLIDIMLLSMLFTCLPSLTF